MHTVTVIELADNTKYTLVNSFANTSRQDFENNG